MRIFAGSVLFLFSLLSVGCGVKLQPPVQGEWEDYHADSKKVSEDAKPKAEKPGEKHAEK